MQVRDLKMLRRLVVVQEVSHRDIAKAVGWSSHSYVSRLLRGEVNTVSPEAAVRIAHFFQVGVQDLFVTKSSSHPGRDNQSSAA